MKKLVLCIGLICLLGCYTASQAQVKEDVKKTAKKVGNKTAETASKAKSAVVDQKYKGKCGPDGQTIYIDNHDKYYWVDKKGRKQYIAKAALKDKVE
jgi:hypothetical protein